MIMKRLLLCISLLLLVGMTSNSRLYAQEDSLEKGLDFIPFSELPYRERELPNSQTDRYCVGFDNNISAKIYKDLQGKLFMMADAHKGFAPDVYLKIALPDKSILGALSFCGVTDYRTDMLFIRDLKWRARDTLECCVMYDELVVKQYELTEMGEVIIYQMIFDSPKLMPYAEYSLKPLPVTGHIHKTTYFIAPTKKCVKMKEEDTDTKSFSSLLLNDHNLWDEKAFGMTYKK